MVIAEEFGITPRRFSFRPVGQNVEVALTGGRRALWLERAGAAAAVDSAMEKLAKIFGDKITSFSCGAVGIDFSSAAQGGGLGAPFDERDHARIWTP